MKINKKKFLYLISPNKIYETFYRDLTDVLKSKKISFFQLRLKKDDHKNKINISKKIKKICKKHKVKFSRKYSIIVNMGPGSYSSIRISLSVAKGIHIVHGSKLYGYKSNQLPELKLENIEILIKNKHLKNKMVNPIY